MTHLFKKLDFDVQKFIEVVQNESDLSSINIEVGFYEENLEKSKDTLGSISLNKKELHSLIGTLLHVQSKMK